VNGIDDAIDGLPARDLERIQARIAKRLQACVIDGRDGAIPVAARFRPSTAASEARISLLLCPACIEKHRLPEGRGGGVSS
jgi:hypothetical protein